MVNAELFIEFNTSPINYLFSSPFARSLIYCLTNPPSALTLLSVSTKGLASPQFAYLTNSRHCLKLS
ncbi:hypothetical protein CBS63078_5272 [Aspergillus niger]|nr:hypothetical protein CBS115989_538 [Aspergillus niger]KAI2830187.1 hypothetical protein CBS133816_3782 [Aspergillus niger]KAI2850890.1 hypothetical protein CBS11350_1482 [Aspergillus niger]KAI2860607.1 hypothetical protein CBS11232_1457 [Aspergillus niger]KAI2867814.1 hypothetical protein CBS12448_260 [Aspergillus niger]